MNNDIVTRLRKLVVALQNADFRVLALTPRDAADEIERLRTELAHAQSEIARLERLATNG